MAQVIQLVAAILILIPFAALQLGRMTEQSHAYLVLNFIGSATLGGIAWFGDQWGFLLLEVVWALFSLWGLVQMGRARAGVDPR